MPKLSTTVILIVVGAVVTVVLGIVLWYAIKVLCYIPVVHYLAA